MSLNKDFSDTFIFNARGIKYTYDTFKVVINYNKKKCTVYTPNGRVLLKIENMTTVQMNAMRKKIKTYLDNKKNINLDFFRGGVVI